MSSVRLQVVSKHLQKSKSASYVYTLDNNVLTDRQRQFYEENGFLVVPNLVEKELLNECKKKFVDICNGIIPKGGMTLMKDKSLMETDAKGQHLYNKIQDISWDEVFSKYILHPKILRYVECFTGPDITAVHSMLINKPPDSGKMTSVHPLHQDLHYLPFRPPERIVASWTAMELITLDNGCLFVVPGSHKETLHPHDYPENEVNILYHGVKGFDSAPKINLIMEKGDTVFFHPLLIHGSGPNRTKGFRKAISCHYASNNCYFIDVKGTSQENIAQEIEALAVRRNLDLTFQDIWKLRQRVISGNPGTLN